MRMNLKKLALAVFAALALMACSSPSYPLVGSQRAPGADGQVVLSEEAGNNMMELEIRNLLPPNRLDEGLTTYTVWIVTEGGTNPLGQLDYDEDERSGRLAATTPASQFTIKVTGEADREATSPSEFLVVARQIGQ